MSKNQLRQYREILEENQAELLAGLHKRDEITIEKAADELDEVQLAGSRDMAIQELDRKAHLLRQVRGALGRIADGSYGLCENCGEQISPKRLAAVPWASLCRQCQEEADQSQGSGAPRGVFSDAA
jgi:DnaK suppressor protein